VSLRRFVPSQLVLLGLMTAACAGGAGGGTSLAGTAWILVELDAEQPLIGASITAEFDEQGRVGGTSGCNSYGGQYQARGESMTIGALAGTLMACAEPVMAQESAFLAALGATASFSISGDRLSLHDSGGDARLVFQAQSTALNGTSWTVLSYNNGEQAVVSVVEATEVTVRFDESGQITGNAGCNDYSASYQISDDSISIGPPSSRRMFCAQPEGVMAQEALFLAALETAATYSLQGNLLELRSADEAIAVRLQQAGR